MSESARSQSRPGADYEQPEAKWMLGTGLIYGGLALFALAVIDRVASLPFSMPDMWYPNRVFMPFFGILAVLAGARLVRVERSLDWSPTRPGRRFSAIVLYTRPGCHLCDDAMDMLRRYSRWLAAPVEVNIDEDSELRDRFHTCVPVVQMDGKVRFKGHVSEVLLRRLIEGTKPVDVTRSGGCGSGACGSGGCSSSGSCSPTARQNGGCEAGSCGTSASDQSCGAEGKCGNGGCGNGGCGNGGCGNGGCGNGGCGNGGCGKGGCGNGKCGKKGCRSKQAASRRDHHH